MCNSPPRHQTPTSLERFLFGAPYYPEHWSGKDREEDPQRMADAGVNVVRMAEFAWDRIEPQPNQFDFSLFDDTIEKMASHGIQTILCTPTAAPPRWLSRSHPDWMRVNADGIPMTHGSRQHFCTNQPGFREESVRITTAMAEHYRDNPHVIGWQTDNEFYCHIDECYCPACLTAFQTWLQEKYGRIDTLNQSWGTSFWALTFDHFEEIPFPYRNRPTHPNPGHMQDYYRFLSASVTEFQSGQVAALRQANPDWWISHNGTFFHIDHWKFAEELDFYGVDVYPGFSAAPGLPDPDPVWAVLKHQDCRAASGNYVVFEQQGGAGGQTHYSHATPRPGQMRLWAWQAVANGADGILHFRWRSCRFGAEIYWNGILDHDNVPRRRYREFAQEGAEFRKLGPKLLGTVQKVEAAILVETDQDEAHTILPYGKPGPWDQRKHLLRALQQRHIATGLVDARDSFDGIKLLFLPGFVLMDDVLAQKLRNFVEQGGTLVASARTATRDRNNHVLSQTPPGWLSALFGITVEECGGNDPLPFELAENSLPYDTYYEILQPIPGQDPQILARWGHPAGMAPHAAPGTPAATLHSSGNGKALYLGTFFGSSNTAALVDLSLAQTSVSPLAKAPPAVEITCRTDGNRTLLFLLNHDGAKQLVEDLPPGVNLLTGSDSDSSISLPAYGVAVIETRV
ncbi:MAG: beta-galactosidase [Puniceicoccales bacterium]